MRFIATTLAVWVVAGPAVADGAAAKAWEEAIAAGDFEKTGLGRLHNPHYQYETLGLGGTTLRMGPYGLTAPGAPEVDDPLWLEYTPYLGYEYWWDERGYRQIPFDLVGGYGESGDPGAIRPATGDHWESTALYSREGEGVGAFLLRERDDAVGQRFQAGHPFNRIDVRMACGDGAPVGKVSLSLFRWRGDYAATVASKPVAEARDCEAVAEHGLTWKLPDAQNPGEYLFVISEPGPVAAGPYAMRGEAIPEGHLYRNGAPATRNIGRGAGQCFSGRGNSEVEPLSKTGPQAQDFASESPVTGIEFDVKRFDSPSPPFRTELYRWNRNAAATLAGKPVASKAWAEDSVQGDVTMRWRLDEPLPPGHYLFTLRAVGPGASLGMWRDVASTWRGTVHTAYQDGRAVPGDFRIRFHRAEQRGVTRLALEARIALEPEEAPEDTFRQHVDIVRGLATVDLTLETAGRVFPSRRELFVTPEGVLVVRVLDAPDKAPPFQLKVTDRVGWTSRSEARRDGLLLSSTRPRSCVATLAVAAEGGDVRTDKNAAAITVTTPATFYIAPGSSYAGAEPAERAWQAAEAARARGYEALRAETEAWWQKFWERSRVLLPDPELSRWYVRSLYYHGVFHGNSDIPPGAYGTNPALWGGCVWPEYDLVFDQLALLYTGHMEESESIADWLYRILPKARENAAGYTLYDDRIGYGPGAAKYTAFLGWDGTILTPGTPPEGTHLYANYPNANAAAMALFHADWTGDARAERQAKEILRATAQCVAEDLAWDDARGGYVDRRKPDALQQEASMYLLSEAVRRGVADPAWREMSEKVHLPTALSGERRVIVGWDGDTPGTTGYGDAPWLQGLWWWGILEPDDPLVAASFDLYTTSGSHRYIFNRGIFSCVAAKMGRSEEALRWLKRLVDPAIIFDDSSIIEQILDFEDYRRTPEIAAHGALICAAVQLLVDPESSDPITLFSALPEAWRTAGVSFDNLRIMGNVSVSARHERSAIEAAVVNEAAEPRNVSVRIRLPEGVDTLVEGPPGIELNDEWALVPAQRLFPGEPVDIRIAWSEKP